MIALIQSLISEELVYLAVVAMSAAIVYVSTPTLIWTSIKHKLFDQSELHRKIHKRNISRLGGVSIFASFTLTVLLFSALFNYQQPIIVIVSSIILFAIGLKDDLYGIGSNTKLVLSLIVAAILVFVGNFRLSSLYGVLFIEEMGVISGGLFSMLLIIFLKNAFNLIDGIDGLSGAIGVIVNLIFGIFFALTDQFSAALVAFSMVGALVGFLCYNFSPSKIFMGDSGSLIIGMVSSIMAINFIELNNGQNQNLLVLNSAPAIAVSILIIPVFDSLLIFFLRLINRKSPFQGDRNHIHHRVKALGLPDAHVVYILASINILCVLATLLLDGYSNFLLISLLLLFCFILHIVLIFYTNRKKKQKFEISQIVLKNHF